MMILVIYKDMTLNARLPFRIAEVYPSIDGGHRTRLTHKCFAKFEEAQEFVVNHEKQKEGE